jgi:4-amino-4-deoxy-L-arabinose transferase-like glycosyltransferase
MQYVLLVSGVIVGAVALDLWLLHWLRQRRQPDEAMPGARELRTDSPVLTWLKHRRLPIQMRRTQRVVSDPHAALRSTSEDAAVAPATASGHPPSAMPTVDRELNYRIVLVEASLSAVGFTALGQQIFTGAPETRLEGLPFILVGVALFVLVWYLHGRRTLPTWFDGLSLRMRLLPFQLTLLPLALGCSYVARVFAGNDALMKNPLAAVICWIIAVGLVIAGTYPAGGRREAGNNLAMVGESWRRWELIAVGGLFVFAFGVRVFNNGGIPAALTGDEGSVGLAAVSYVEGHFNNPFIVSWFAFPSFFFTLPATAIAFLGHTYAALRLPSAVAGALTVVGLYWLARPMFGRMTAGISATLLAVLNFHIHFSRIGLNNIWDGLFLVFTLGLLWRGWQTGGRLHFIAAGLLVGLSQFFYSSAAALPLIILAWLALNAITGWHDTRQHLPDLFSMALVAVVVYLPLGLYFLSHPDDYFAPINRVTILNNGWLDMASRSTGLRPWQLLINNYRDSALAFTSLPLRAWYDSGKPMLLALPATLFIFGVVLAVFNLRDRRYWLLLLWLASAISVGALTENTPAAQRYIIGAPVAVLLAGIALAAMAGWVIDVWPRWRGMTYGAVMAVLVVSAWSDLSFYFGEYALKGGQGDGNTQVAGALGQYLKTYPAGSQVFFFGPPRMGYSGFSTLPYLAPQVHGQDVAEVLTAPPDWSITDARAAAFVFLPERETELAFVSQRYPGGASKSFYNRDGLPLFLVYEIIRR